MRVVIVHNAVRDNSLPDEEDVIKQAEMVGISLTSLGHEVTLLPCDLNLNSLKLQLKERSPDMVFNLVESLDGDGRLIHVVPFLLDALAIPYSGASAEAIYHTSHKVMAKERMRAAGLPTPDWINPFPPDLPWMGGASHIAIDPSTEQVCAKKPLNISSAPATSAYRDSGAAVFTDPVRERERIWIIKSLWEHASFGIDEDNVVAGTRKMVADLLKQRASQLGGACFAELFIDGREFNISLLGNGKSVLVMPPAEIIFKNSESNSPRIVGYKAKWVEDADEYQNTPRSFDFSEKDGELLKVLKKLSIRCWNLFNLRGYARVDFRVDHNQKPKILEINANPCISPDAGFAAALQRGGISYDEAIAHILNESCYAPIE